MPPSSPCVAGENAEPGAAHALTRGTARGSSPRIIIGALYLVALSVVARTVVDAPPGGLLWLAVLEAVYLVLFTLLWFPRVAAGTTAHAVLACQTLVVMALVLMNPEVDYVASFFVPLSYQAAVVFGGRTRWVWPAGFMVLTAAPLMVFLGPLRGLAVALLPMVGQVVLPAYAAANQEVQATNAAGVAMIAELEGGRQRLQSYLERVEDLAAVEERNRLSRELHDSVSQTLFSIQLATRSAQLLVDRDPARVGPQLAELHRLTQDALAQMRSLIAELRPATPGGAQGSP